MSVCTSIERIETGVNGDLLKVTIDNTTEALWFFDYSSSLMYLNQEVIVDYRREIYNGEFHQFVKTFVLPQTVQTLDKEDNIKLYCDIEDNLSNLSFSEIAMNESRAGCVVFCTSCEFKASTKAVWQELKIRDRSMHVATLRVFDYANKEADYTGHYIVTELLRNNYGFTTEFIDFMKGEPPVNPEISIARQFITSYFADDTVSMDFISQTGVLEYLEDLVDYERGYGLVRLATELSMVDAMKNMTKDLDLKAIGRALLASRGYITHASILSSSVNSIIVAMKYKWDNRKTVMLLLDTPQEGENLPERAMMKSIVSMVDTMITLRKGVV